MKRLILLFITIPLFAVTNYTASKTYVNSTASSCLSKSGDTAGDLTVTNLYVGKAELYADESKDQLTVNGVSRMYVRDVICSNLIVEATDTWYYATPVVYSNTVKFTESIGDIKTGNIDTEGDNIFIDNGDFSYDGGSITLIEGNIEGGAVDIKFNGSKIDLCNNCIVSNIYEIRTSKTYFEFHLGTNTYRLGVK